MRKIGLLLAFFWIRDAYAQDLDTSLGQVLKLPTNYIDKIESNATEWQDKLVNNTDKYLRNFTRLEGKLRKKLNRIDSNSAKQLFDDAQKKYSQLRDKLNGSIQTLDKYTNSYIPLLDSLTTSLNFLGTTNLPLLQNIKGTEQISDALSKLNSLQGRLNQAEQIKDFIRERKQLLVGQLSKFGMLKDLKKFNEKLYYYQVQLAEYKQALKEPEKLIAKSLSILQKNPAFREFFLKHSELASLFRLPGSGNPIDPASLAGLQTRASVQNLIGQRFGSGSNTQQMLQQNIGDAQSQLNKLKDKINQLGGTGSSEIDMPDFKPQSVKTKTFWKRLEYGTNIQTVRANGFFPTTTDLAVSLGYRVSDKSTAGVAIATKMGWGESFRKINITWQGIGLRSFIDVKIKGSFFVSGGAEMNYRNQIRDFHQLNNFSAWQKSALLGVTKKYSIGKKWKGNMQLLFDFLYKNQVSNATPVLFRVGYLF